MSATAIHPVDQLHRLVAGVRAALDGHTTWCVFGVIQGVEHEDVYDADVTRIGSSVRRYSD